LDSPAASSNPAALASKPAFSSQAYKKLVTAHDAKELRKGVDALRRRVEKHFGDYVEKDEQEYSRNLVAKVLTRCEDRFTAEIEKFNGVPKQIYASLEDGAAPVGGLAVTKDDVSKWFRGMR
jgi:exocyst complex component 1